MDAVELTEKAAGKVENKIIEWVIDTLVGYIPGSINLYEQQLNTQRKLAVGLYNRDIGSYTLIKEKAENIQDKGIYTDETMIEGAMELSKYFDDANAVASMMDTLSDYAAGMSGGGAVDAGTMARFADSIGKIAKGDYVEAEQNGFRISDAQKAVIEKLVPEDRYTGIYKDMSDDMRSAAVISEVLNQNVGGMYETVSNSPQGTVAELKNSFSVLGEEIVREVYPSMGRSAERRYENDFMLMEQISDVKTEPIDKFKMLIDKTREKINEIFELIPIRRNIAEDVVSKGVDTFEKNDRIMSFFVRESYSGHEVQTMKDVYNSQVWESEERRQARSDEIVSRMTEAFGEDIMPAERAAGMESEFFIGDIPSIDEIYNETSFGADGENRVEVVFESGSITNNITSETAVDEIMDEFANRLREAITTAAEGVYAY